MNEEAMVISIEEVIHLSEEIHQRLIAYQDASLKPGTAVSNLEISHVHRLSELLMENLESMIS
jgi:hypothetical protein